MYQAKFPGTMISLTDLVHNQSMLIVKSFPLAKTQVTLHSNTAQLSSNMLFPVIVKDPLNGVLL
jgi:hypothetical protein